MRSSVFYEGKATMRIFIGTVIEAPKSIERKKEKFREERKKKKGKIDLVTNIHC